MTSDGKLKEFTDLPDILPIRLKSDAADEESKVEKGDINLSDAHKEDKRDELLSKFEMIKTRKLVYEKPICIIYNPNSGKKADLVPLIENRLN